MSIRINNGIKDEEECKIENGNERFDDDFTVSHESTLEIIDLAMIFG